MSRGIFQVAIFSFMFNVETSKLRAFRHPHTHPYTNIHTPTSVHQATFEVSKVHTPTYIYIIKTQNVHFFGYLYKKKNPFELSNIHTHSYTNIRTPTSIHQHPYTKLLLRFQRSIHQPIFI